MMAAGGPWVTLHCGDCGAEHDVMADRSESLGTMYMSAFQCRECGEWNTVPKSAAVQ